MNWEYQLITLYLRICKEYDTKLWMNCQRFTNGGVKDFSDEEVMTIYIMGILMGFSAVKSIHRFAKRYLLDWFPGLPKYEAYLHRVNRLHEAFRGLIDALQSEQVSAEDGGYYLIDSFPVVLAKNQHAYTAKVATELASKSYNATKKMYYHGIKIHVVARKRENALPDVEILMLEEAARQDAPVFEQILPMLSNNHLFGDQAYKRPDAATIESQQHLTIWTPVKKAKGQKALTFFQKLYSNAVSTMRQPIEALFGWIDRITRIENAGLVRSTAGLLTHTFGRLAAAMMLRAYPFFDF